MKTYDVYGIGNALVDMVSVVEENFFARMNIDKGLMTLIDEKRHDELLPHLNVEKRESGGSAANAMIVLCHMGGDGFYSCKVANDEMGHFYLNDLKAAGLDTNLHPDTLRDGVTGKCMVMVTKDAERTFHTHLGITEAFSTEELVEDAIRKSKYLYIEGYLVAQKTGQRAAVEAVSLAKKHGVKTSLTFSDPNMVNYFRQGMDEIIGEGLDLIFCNQDEALAYAGTTDLGDACEKLKSVAMTFAITRGALGALVYDGTKLLEIPSCKVNAVDTLGAGDMFAGTFLYAITHGYDYEQAARLASLAASKVVTRYGPRLTPDETREVWDCHRKGAYRWER